jgi:hypothetical protein
MAVVDLGPERIVEALGVIRGSKAHAAVPLLVEAGRISTDFGLAGVLPSYRAMPCCQNEMAALARHHFTETTGRRNFSGIL